MGPQLRASVKRAQAFSSVLKVAGSSTGGRSRSDKRHCPCERTHDQSIATRKQAFILKNAAHPPQSRAAG